jgi:hypothetical protein
LHFHNLSSIFTDYKILDKIGNGSFGELFIAEKKNTQEKFVNETFEYSLLDAVVAPTGLPLLNQLGIPNVRLGQLTDVAKTQELLITSGLL